MVNNYLEKILSARLFTLNMYYNMWAVSCIFVFSFLSMQENWIIFPDYWNALRTFHTCLALVQKMSYFVRFEA